MERFYLLALAATFTCFAQSAITTFAGRDPQFDSDGKPAIQAKIGSPRGIALDGKGNIFFTDEGFSLVLKVDAAGRLSVAANAQQVTNPRGIAIDSDGNIYVADAVFVNRLGAPVPLRYGRIRKIARDGSVATIAGAGSNPDKDDIPALEAELGSCSGLTIDAAGNLYIAEVERNRVRRIGRDGMIRTVAGNGELGFGPPPEDVGDGGPATKASLRGPTDVAIDRDGGLLIADWQNYRIRRVDPEGIIHTVAGGGHGPLDEGKATEMDLDGPFGVAAGLDGSFYLFDWFVITRVTPDGQAARVTNWSPSADVPEGGPAAEAYVAGAIELSGMAVDAVGNLYLVDARRSRVRRIGRD